MKQIIIYLILFFIGFSMYNLINRNKFTISGSTFDCKDIIYRQHCDLDKKCEWKSGSGICINKTPSSTKRFIYINNKQFYKTIDNEIIVLRGINIVLKGPPWIPDSITKNNSNIPSCEDTKIIGCSLPSNSYDNGNFDKDSQTVCFNKSIEECEMGGICKHVYKGEGSIFSKNSEYIGLSGEECRNFGLNDINHLKKQSINSIRLGIPWAGGQSSNSNELDIDFKKRLHKILTLCDKNNINVLLDNHGDQTGSLNCGYGVPPWFTKLAIEDYNKKNKPNIKIGEELKSSNFSIELNHFLHEIIDWVDNYNKIFKNKIELPFTAEDIDSGSALDGIARIERIKPNGNICNKWNDILDLNTYYLNNECCSSINGGSNQTYIGFTNISQITLDYLFTNGRKYFVNYWKLIANEIKHHPSAYGLELMNEPMYLNRNNMYETWVDVIEEVVPIIPDISVGICDFGNGSFSSTFLMKLLFKNDFISSLLSSVIDKIFLKKYPLVQNVVKNHNIKTNIVNKIQKKKNNIFYCWHWYGTPSSINDAQEYANNISNLLDIPNVLTESSRCDEINSIYKKGTSIYIWHYAAYCNTNESFIKKDNYGGCVLGWASGDNSKCNIYN